MTSKEIMGWAELEGTTIDERHLKVGNHINMILVNPITKEEEIIVVEIVEPSNKSVSEIPGPVKENVTRLSEVSRNNLESSPPAKSIPKKIILVVSVKLSLRQLN